MADLNNPDPTTVDSRGLVPANIAEAIRKLRAAEAYSRYDTICIGRGANARDRGWFDTWSDFARADILTFFGGRASNVGQSYTNQPSERTDWAQDFFQMHFILQTTIGNSAYAENPMDGTFMPGYFTNDLPQTMPVGIQLAEADTIMLAPMSHYPAGHGPSGVVVGASAAPVMFGGTNGDSHVSNAWKWPDPIMLAAKSKITVSARVDNPAKEFLLALPPPGDQVIETSGGTVRLPVWYKIQCVLVGPRYLQLRGARSSS